jgi:Cytochrome b(N-terminal)/b6/petB
VNVGAPPPASPSEQQPGRAPPPTVTSRRWTDRLRERALGAGTPERLLPAEQPTYVASWIYLFGVATISALIVVVSSGVILGLNGPAWWHSSGIGHFFNSLHLWAVELFFFFMVIHLWGKYWMAAWRGGRIRVWLTGAGSSIVAVPTALTGYVSQQNFDAQWISTQAKDGLNSIGAGAFFNVTNFGQMYSYHILILPLAVVVLVIWHVLLVRRHGLVPPFDMQARPASASAPERPGAAESPERAASAVRQ